MEKKQQGFRNQRSIVLPQQVIRQIDADPLAGLLYVTDIGYFPKAKGHYTSQEKGAEQHILIYCCDGSGWCEINKKYHRITKNQFFVIKANTAHSYGADKNSPWSIFWIHFTGKHSTLFESMFNRIGYIEKPISSSQEDRSHLFESILENLELGYGIENLHYTTLCLWHLLGSFQYIPQFQRSNKTKTTDSIQQAIGFMKEHISERLTLSTIAKSVSYSPSHFGVLFTQKTNTTPLDYFNQLKIQKACTYLDFTNMQIKEIASELGFYDSYHFSKVFRKYIGLSPVNYRQKQKGNRK